MNLKYNLPISLVAKATEQNALSTLYYYCVLRGRYKNRVIYDFTYQKASDIAKISKSNIRTHVLKLMEWGLCEKQSNGCLKFKGLKKILQRNDTIISFRVRSNKKSQILEFRHSLIHNNLGKQFHLISKKNKIVSKAKGCVRLSRKEERMIDAKGSFSKFESSIQNETTLSLVGFGALLNRSSSSAKRYKKQMVSDKLIGCKPRYDILGKIDKSMLSLAKKEYDCYYLTYYNGRLLKRRSDTIQSYIPSLM